MQDNTSNPEPKANAVHPQGIPPVMIVSGHRERRRRLFDMLDARGYRVALSASSGEQASQYLAKNHSIELLFFDLGEGSGGLENFMSGLEKIPDRGPVRVIGVLPAGASVPAAEWTAYGSLADVIRADIDDGELAFRLQRLLASPGRESGGSGDRRQPAQGFGGSLIDLMPDPALLLDPASLAIVSANPALERLTGHDRAEFIGKSFFELDSSHDESQKAELVSALRRDGQLRFQARLPGPSTSGTIVEASLQLGACDGETRYLAALRDLGSFRQLQRVLKLITESFDPYLEQDRLSATVKRCASLLGFDCVLLAYRSDRESQIELHAVVAPASVRETLVADMETGMLQRVSEGNEVLVRDGAWRQAEPGDRFLRDERMETFIGIPLVDSSREVIGILAAASRRHLSNWKLALRTLQTLARRYSLEIELNRLQADPRTIGLYDSVTQLPNRLLFEDRLRNAINEARRNSELFAVVFVDLDRFRNVNDSYGHDIGDSVLRGVARRLGSTIRASDTVSRYAGDEFLLILRHVTQKENVKHVVRKLNEALGQGIDLGEGRQVQITASIGISFYPDDGGTIDELIKHADQAMYGAKSLGRNTFQAYVSEPEESRQQKMVLESKLRSAERNNELRVFYQPQVSAETEDIIGMEALIRWEHPDMGLISPGFFIPLAEETGLIVPIGKWLLREACRQVREWQDRFHLPLRLGVNLSALQLKQPGIAGDISEALTQTGLAPELLDLEVTESISIKDVQNLLEVLQALRDLGCGISIDDFGTGQSSLDYIKRFPADRIKIDQIFVRNIGVDPDDAAIVEATINMAHNLNRSVVAEGVEEEQQLEFLRHNGCEELQGFLFSRPLPAEAFEKLLADRERLLSEQSAASG